MEIGGKCNLSVALAALGVVFIDEWSLMHG